MRKLIKFKIHHIIVFVTVILIVLAGGSGRTVSIRAADASYFDSNTTFWYYVDTEKVYLPLTTDAVTIIYNENLTDFERDIVTNDINDLASVAELKEWGKPKQAIVELKSGLSKTELLTILNELRSKPGVRIANPIFTLPDAKITITDQFIARFKPNVQIEVVEAFNQANNVEIVNATRLPNTYILSVGAVSNTIDMANLYHESDITIYATPDFVRSLDKQFIPNDTLFPGQWGMENTGTNPPDGVGTADADIDASAAWDIALGDPGTVIAIIDEGVELDHEDLNDKIMSQYSAIPGDSNANPNNTWDAHGTNCAGIATAETNNSQGAAGVCPYCSLMPVQIAYSESVGGSWITVDSWIADAIIWSVDNGADVLSNSWGGGTPSSFINDAITYAITNGRDGLGSVLLFAAGNGDNWGVIYPASNNNTIAVGASSPCDERKNPSSCDGEGWWGSNYGSDLDVVAPGVEWWTTDMMGAAGYSNGNYFNHMNGTSSATPAVAGLAGLIISHRPCLNEAQVQEIIEQGADDQVGLPGEDTPGWDQYMGWGRINAYQALLLANNYSCGQDIHSQYLPLVLR
jgi:subtilisin family serine protease